MRERPFPAAQREWSCYRFLPSVQLLMQGWDWARKKDKFPQSPN